MFLITALFVLGALAPQLAEAHNGTNGGFFTSQSAMYRDRKVGYVFLTNNDQGDRFHKALRAFLIEAPRPALPPGCRAPAPPAEGIWQLC
ncbi:MAG: hypothetical protein HYW07_15205 [Candidatus Latescibacteria bacterium]|nr:hypothetical protein [Candidatus Latescibacterota bacterium]